VGEKGKKAKSAGGSNGGRELGKRKKKKRGCIVSSGRPQGVLKNGKREGEKKTEEPKRGKRLHKERLFTNSPVMMESGRKKKIAGTTMRVMRPRESGGKAGEKGEKSEGDCSMGFMYRAIAFGKSFRKRLGRHKKRKAKRCQPRGLEGRSKRGEGKRENWTEKSTVVPSLQNYVIKIKNTKKGCLISVSRKKIHLLSLKTQNLADNR